MNQLLTSEEAAIYLRKSRKTLARWRCEDSAHLPYIKIGSNVYYEIKDLDNFINHSRILPGSEYS